jgi:hypothetical protein
MVAVQHIHLPDLPVSPVSPSAATVYWHEEFWSEIGSGLHRQNSVDGIAVCDQSTFYRHRRDS